MEEVCLVDQIYESLSPLAKYQQCPEPASQPPTPAPWIELCSAICKLKRQKQDIIIIFHQ